MRTVPVSPDGERYLAMARGQTMPRPFLFRWLAPALLGPDPNQKWAIAARVSFVAVCVLGGIYAHAWEAALIPLGLAGLTVQVRAPILVDLHAMALALGSALCAQHGFWAPCVILALTAATVKETSPLFAAAWSWSWVPLVGIVMVGYALFMQRGEEQSDVCGGHAHEALVHPLRTAWGVHRRQPLAWWTLPLGVLLIGACVPTLQVGVVLVLAYGQCVLATDLVRLYVWSWPVLAARTFAVIPSRWWPLLVIVHIASPHRGEGW